MPARKPNGLAKNFEDIKLEAGKVSSGAFFPMAPVEGCFKNWKKADNKDIRR
jgi:hypothetical protein